MEKRKEENFKNLAYILKSLGFPVKIRKIDESGYGTIVTVEPIAEELRGRDGCSASSSQMMN